jgi:glycosyltransferase involved in cell wall biosynthesis
MIEAPEAGWYLVKGGSPVDVTPGAQGWAEVVDADDRVHRLPMGRLHPGVCCNAIVGIPLGARQMRFLATSADGDSPLSGFQLQRLGRGRAYVRMLVGNAGEGRSGKIRYTLRTALAATRPLLRGDLRSAGIHLAASYQHSLGRGAVVPCGVSTTRGGVLRPAEWRPIHQLEADASADQMEWRATGDDPRFQLWCQDMPASLPGGWYRIDCRTTVDAGRMISPALYPDYGHGDQPYDMVRLPDPDRQGRIHALILLKSNVKTLRFDPSVRRLRFRVEKFELRRVGRAGALFLLLDRSRYSDGSRDWPTLIGTARSFVADALRHGLSAAASRLHRGDGGDSVEANDYANWVRRYDSFDGDDLRMMKERAGALGNGPLISVLLPVYETPERWLRRCIDSVIGQAYSRWELCIVDDASPSPHVTRILAEYVDADERIRFQRREANGHISLASNDALAMARGQFVALLDHDDELRPHALLEVAESLVDNPGAALVYSDEDKIDEQGRRFQPNFKPDWNPDLLLSQNYICHFTVIDADLVRRAGCFRAGYEGSQDHDLFLRCTERLEPSQVLHIPRVLYHWRAISGSTALERGAKDYASAAGVRAVSDHLMRVAPGAQVDELAHGHYRVRWPLPSRPPKVSIIVPTRDRVKLLSTCVESVLAKTRYPDFEIIIVDNQSIESDTLAYLDRIQLEDSRVRVLKYDAPFNYSAINNWAATQATGSVLCLLNNDIEVIDGGWLHELVSHGVRSKIGAVGAMLYYQDMTIQHAGVILGLGGVANHVYAGKPAGHPGHGARALVVQNMSAVTGACLVTRRDIYEQVGGLDENLQVAFNDIDYCLRLMEDGYRNVWTPFATLIHHESASRGRDEEGEKRERFLGEVRHMEQRWGELLHRDPSYNPNLSLEELNSGLAFPPRMT